MENRLSGDGKCAVWHARDALVSGDAATLQDLSCKNHMAVWLMTPNTAVVALLYSKIRGGFSSLITIATPAFPRSAWALVTL